MDGIRGGEAAIDQVLGPPKDIGRQYHSTHGQELKDATPADFVGDRCDFDFRHSGRYLLVLASVDSLQDDRHGIGREFVPSGRRQIETGRNSLSGGRREWLMRDAPKMAVKLCSETNSQGSEDEPEQRWDEFFRFRPILLYRVLAAEMESHQSAQAKRDYATNMIRRSVYSLLDRRILTPLAALAALGAVAWFCLDQPEVDRSNVVIAVFSVVAGLATMAGWFAMLKQNQIMQQQMEQTEAIISHMRREHRGWLSTSGHSFDHSDLAEPAQIKFQFVNSGSSPCTVTEFRIGLGVDADITTAEQDARANLQVRRMTEIGRAIVPPGSKTGHTSWLDVTLQPHESKAVASGTARYCIVVKFNYTTAGADDCETGQMITYYTGNGQISYCGDHSDNYMK